MKRYIATLLLLAACASVQAREVFPLNEGWRFFFKSENSSDNARHVTLPHTWNTDTGACGYFLETTANYQNDMYIPAEWASKRLFVKFYGVQNVADLFVNGYHVGAHRGGSTAFTFEITDKIRFGEDNALLVVVSNNSRDDVLPASTDMNLYGGIYREAELILTGKTAVSPLHLGSEGVLVRQNSVTSALVEGEAEIYLTSAGESTCMLTLDITAPDGRKVFTKRQKTRLDGRPVVIPFSIADPQLWSPSSPALYRVTASIGEETVTDSVTVRTGFRNIQVTTAGGLTINGERIPVHGVTLYHDNAISGGAVLAQDYDADLQQIRDLGANALRSAVMPHAQYLYDRCDEQGLLVWVDSPLHRSSFLGDVAYFATPQFEQNGIQQLQEIIAQNYNHPSVVMWGIFSRLWMRGDDVTPYLRRLNDTAHAMDRSRPTVACSDQNGGLNFITDLIVWRQDVGWRKGSTDDVAVWRNQLQKNWSNLRSGVCYGGSGFIGHKSYTAQAAPRSNWMPEERQTRFHEEYVKNLQNDSLFWGTWINNMFDYGSARRPYGINGEGLVTIDRRERKDAYYLYRALWNERKPTLHIVDKRRSLRDRNRQAFSVYSSVGAPTLFVGADTVAMTQYAACQYRSDSVEIQGIVQVKAVAGEQCDSVTLRVGNVLKPKRQPVPRRTAGPQQTN
ncbi:glycoside hydrolase family 2 TIM barrel-domain containing protein [uncultured Alistipes sp.]|uniref:glycoside hydrolase family 2 protein n=1 Tax=uncultured Alistipes sp. TaxID=538949 RepID=UPI0025893467|nr:glycoside hydrolase family 2 TIM barrel-domain containing protein [uncultured Alistipes sp.]